jgi:hypothetical protein
MKKNIWLYSKKLHRKRTLSIRNNTFGHKMFKSNNLQVSVDMQYALKCWPERTVNWGSFPGCVVLDYGSSMIRGRGL